MNLKLISKFETAGNEKIQLAFGPTDSTLSPMAPGMFPNQSSLTMYVTSGEASAYTVGETYTVSLDIAS